MGILKFLLPTMKSNRTKWYILYHFLEAKKIYSFLYRFLEAKKDIWFFISLFGS